MKIEKRYLILASIITVLSFTASCVLFFHGNYDEKIMIKLGIKTPEIEKNWAVYSWDSCLEQLCYDSDIAFIGDSITCSGNFQEYFPDEKIVNLGYAGDNIEGVTKRISMLKHTSPEKIFIMVGINVLTNNSIDECVVKYSTLLTTLKEELPEAKVYVQSVLPISKAKEKELDCSNDTVKNFNLELKKLAEQNQMEYIDLFSSFVENSQIKSNLSKDGVHINSKGYEIWVNAIFDFVKF